ncbi:MAG TPA: MFS transporter [Gemmataceae bacterium]|nr:MFS transporter [Gemmataceae bacterium]
MSRGGYRWAVVGMLWFVCMFNYADRQAIFSVFPLLKEQMQLSLVDRGVLASAFMWPYALALPFAGVIADRVNRKALILGGLVFWSLITLATGFATEFWHLVVFRALEGLGEAFYFPASMSLISDYHGKDTRSRAMGLHQSSVYAGTVLGGVVAGYCGDTYGWQLGFYVFGGLGVVLAAVLVLALREPIRGATEPDAVTSPPTWDVFRGAGEVVRIPMALMLTAVFVGANFVAIIFLTWMPTYLHDTFKMDLTMSGLNATLWLQAASVVGVICGGWLADQWSRQMAGGRPLVQALGLFLGAPLIAVTGWTLEIPTLVLAMAGFGFCKGLYDANIWASLYDSVPAHRRATAQGLMNSIGWLGAAFGPIAIAAGSARYGMGPCLSATSILYVGCGILLVVGTLVFVRSRPKEAVA